MDGVYVALRCDASEFPGLLVGIARAGGAGNVTIPHKARAAELVDVPTEAVIRTGACNTFWLEDGRIHGDNTDVAGFRAAVRTLLGSVHGARVLLLGAGGAASAAVAGLVEEGAARIAIHARSPERARSLAARFDAGPRIEVLEDLGREGPGALTWWSMQTPLSLHADDRSHSLRARAGVAAALDLVYAPGETAWVHEARRRGIAAADGRGSAGPGRGGVQRWWRRPARSRRCRALESRCALLGKERRAWTR